MTPFCVYIFSADKFKSIDPGYHKAERRKKENPSLSLSSLLGALQHPFIYLTAHTNYIQPSQPPLIRRIHTIRLLPRPPHPPLNQLFILCRNFRLLLLGNIELHIERKDFVLDLLEHLFLAAQFLALVPHF